ncbi:TPA: MarR family winged helix-turn-helix transcriptional regulator [Pseudomonas aeruginosa]
MPKIDEVDQDAEELYEALSHLVRVYQFRDRDRSCCGGLSVTQCYALEHVIKSGPVRVQSLAIELFLDKSNASRLVDSLGKQGLVRRIPDVTDGRAVAISATPKGLAVYERIRSDLVGEARHLSSDLSTEARNGAIKLLRRFANATEQRCGLKAPENDECQSFKGC